ncbi:hypothetical protein ENSA5_56590 [Enhygromyxa salina]|uniref:Uncharacterized protein n=1 Tax=Enhygromyxa salina TaxID=215803 RepID=A0A2S9XEY1_9BACT|nr:hypothetical protein [Enhygromyxa salina]PRP91310.1 hypothetical protein ENSA5_56590 [Enhygromyxa salina]
MHFKTVGLTPGFGASALLLTSALACSGPERPEDTDATPPPPELVELSVRGMITCMSDSKLRAKCWGRGTWAQHGVQTTESLGDDEPVAEIPALALGTGVEQISASLTSVCALLEGRRSFRCWGGGPRTRRPGRDWRR